MIDLIYIKTLVKIYIFESDFLLDGAFYLNFDPNQNKAILQKRASPPGTEHMLTYTSDTVLEHII